MTYSIPPITTGAPDKKIIIPENLWVETWLGLRVRGRGKVESAALWAGKRNASAETVEGVYFLDDFAGRVQDAAYHCVPPRALAEVFARLQQDRRVIVGDIHTHPTRWVGLSQLDQEHPIEFRKGLYAVVLPSFAMPSPSLDSTGVHEYLGDSEWRTLSRRAKKHLFIFT